jgi:hypothetical protein
MISIIRAAPKPFRPGRLPSKMLTGYHAVYGSQTDYQLGRPNPGARQRDLKDHISCWKLTERFLVWLRREIGRRVVELYVAARRNALTGCGEAWGSMNEERSGTARSNCTGRYQNAARIQFAEGEGSPDAPRLRKWSGARKILSFSLNAVSFSNKRRRLHPRGQRSESSLKRQYLEEPDSESNIRTSRGFKGVDPSVYVDGV